MYAIPARSLPGAFNFERMASSASGRTKVSEKTWSQRRVIITLHEISLLVLYWKISLYVDCEFLTRTWQTVISSIGLFDFSPRLILFPSVKNLCWFGRLCRNWQDGKGYAMEESRPTGAEALWPRMMLIWIGLFCQIAETAGGFWSFGRG
jgi:hypothetical protein